MMIEFMGEVELELEEQEELAGEIEWEGVGDLPVETETLSFFVLTNTKRGC